MKKIAALIALAIAFPQTAIAQSLVVGFPESTSVTLVFEGTPNSLFDTNIWTLSAASQVPLCRKVGSNFVRYIKQ